MKKWEHFVFKLTKRIPKHTVNNLNIWISKKFHDFSKIMGIIFSSQIFFKPGNMFKIPGFFQVFHDRNNPAHSVKMCAYTHTRLTEKTLSG